MVAKWTKTYISNQMLVFILLTGGIMLSKDQQTELVPRPL